MHELRFQTILIVSDEPALLSTRALMLNEWDCATTSVADAPDALCEGVYDLIVFCQTVPDGVAIELVEIARKINQDVKVLTISIIGGPFDHAYPSEMYTVDFAAPERLREVVANVLAQQP